MDSKVVALALNSTKSRLCALMADHPSHRRNHLGRLSEKVDHLYPAAELILKIGATKGYVRGSEQIDLLFEDGACDRHYRRYNFNRHVKLPDKLGSAAEQHDLFSALGVYCASRCGAKLRDTAAHSEHKA